jgi:acetyltransferase
MPRRAMQALDYIFNPKRVAVVGATQKEGSVGRTVLWNLISSPFGGTVYPINPNHDSILGIKAYSSLKAVSDPLELVVITTPAPSVPPLVSECADLGVKAVIVISAGFKETGPEGAELERQIMEQARRGNMRIIGPNCLGVMNPGNGFNATFAAGIARPGNVGFISQSGALCTAVLDWSFYENVGFSAFVSVGSMLDIGWADLIDYLGNDPHTKSIVIYMETIGDARSFLSAAREVALTKPIIVIKPGRTKGAAKAAASHTGSLTGSDDVLDAAFKRCGVLRVNSIAELFYMSEVLSKQPTPKGCRMTIVTNAGGPGVIATDALLSNGGELAEISPATMEQLNTFLPSAWSHNNPIDVLGDAKPDRYTKTLELAANDPNSDGLLVILTPQSMTDCSGIAESLKPYAQRTGKPILASWMGGQAVFEGEEILNKANIPTFPYPDTAARMFIYMYRFAENLHGLYETPALPATTDADAPDTATAQKIIESVHAAGRTLLTEAESKQMLAAYRLPTVETRIARTLDEAIQAAEAIGYPVVLKLFSETITHKTDVGGVRLNLGNVDEVKEAYHSIRNGVIAQKGEKAPGGQPHFLGVTVQPMIKLEGYEIILGSSIDPQFGPVLLFGSGGQMVEVFKDNALGLPPLNTTLARRMMEQTKIYAALKGVRGRKPVDLARLEQLLVRFSQLVAEQPWIEEIDINPLLVTEERIIVLDARVVLHSSAIPEDQLPRLAIRPYPIQYAGKWNMPDDTEVLIRPIRPEDEPMLIRFYETLSDRSIYMRFLQPLSISQRINHERLSRICFTDYDREIALAAEAVIPGTNERVIMGMSRLTKIPGTTHAEFNVVINDSFQRRYLGTELVRRILQVAQNEKITHIFSVPFLSNNLDMMRIANRLGMKWTPTENNMGYVSIEL